MLNYNKYINKCTLKLSCLDAYKEILEFHNFLLSFLYVNACYEVCAKLYFKK